MIPLATYAIQNAVGDLWLDANGDWVTCAADRREFDNVHEAEAVCEEINHNPADEETAMVVEL